MKKIIVLFLVLFTFYFVSAKQPKQAIAPTPTKQEIKAPEPIKPDSTTTANVDSITLKEYLLDLNLWVKNCGGEGKLLYDRGKNLGVNVVDTFKGLPSPNTKEGLDAWVSEATNIFDSVLAAFAVGSPLAMILTRLLSLFKVANPEQVANRFRQIASAIRTRYFIFGSSLVVTVISAIYFNDGSFGIGDLLTSFLTLFGVTIGQMGFQAFLEMVGINWFKAKKV